MRASHTATDSSSGESWGGQGCPHTGVCAAGVPDKGHAGNDDPVGNVSHQTQIVGDEQVGHLPLPAEPHQHIDDLGLNGNVQGRARLVRDEQVPLGHDRHGNAHPLLHPAAELVGIAGQNAGRVRDQHLGQGLGCPFQAFLFGQAHPLGRLRAADHVHHVAADGEHRVEGAGRLLEHHGDMPPQQGRTLLFRHRVQGLSLQGQLPGGDLGGALWQKVHQGFHGGGFAAAGLPHQADLLPPVNVEVNAVQHLGVAPITVVPYTEVFYLHQR